MEPRGPVFAYQSDIRIVFISADLPNGKNLTVITQLALRQIYQQFVLKFLILSFQDVFISI